MPGTSPRRIVVTGFGIVSPLGNDGDAVSRSLREGVSGIRHMPEYAELGLRSQVGGACEIDLDALIDRKQKRWEGNARHHIVTEGETVASGAKAQPPSFSVKEMVSGCE